MSDTLVPIDPTLLTIIKGLAGGGLPLPYVQEIMLLDCHVAGTTHVAAIDKIEPLLLVGDALVFHREPDNPHDQLAILILDERGNKLGYVPQAKNEVLARLMDAGKLIYGKVVYKELKDGWLRIGVRVLMRDY